MKVRLRGTRTPPPRLDVASQLQRSETVLADISKMSSLLWQIGASIVRVPRGEESSTWLRSRLSSGEWARRAVVAGGRRPPVQRNEVDRRRRQFQ